MDEVSNGGYVRQGWVLNIHKFAAVSGRTREREIRVCAGICVCFRDSFFATRVGTETLLIVGTAQEEEEEEEEKKKKRPT